MPPSTKRNAGTWVLERTGADKFPYRICILAADGTTSLSLRAQDRWPAANRNIFCLREDAGAAAEGGADVVERVPIVALQRRCVRLRLVLDRARYKRCDFLFLQKAYKGRPGQSYEEIYWQTQTSLVQRRPYVAPAALRAKRGLTVAIASDERYPWRFAGSETVRRKLPCGDYALLDGENVVAVVERKTMTNLLADFGVMPLLQQRLLELATYEHHALVIEAPYDDFLNPSKLQHYSATYCAAAIAELYVSHPRLRIVFCANRKTANLWTASFFAAVQARPPSP